MCVYAARISAAKKQFVAKQLYLLCFMCRIDMSLNRTSDVNEEVNLEQLEVYENDYRHLEVVQKFSFVFNCAISCPLAVIGLVCSFAIISVLANDYYKKRRQLVIPLINCAINTF